MPAMLLRPRLDVSFSGCAWLFPFHLGVIAGMRHYPAFERAVYLGASSGSIAALAAICELDLQACLQLAIDMAHDAKKRRLGPVLRMSRYVRSGLEALLPRQAHRAVHGRLLVSLTRLPRFKNELRPAIDLQSNRELIDLILCSCYIPIYYERPARFRGRFYLDGGATDNLPSPSPFTIKVCPTPSLQASNSHVVPATEPSFRDVLIPNTDTMQRLFAEGRTQFHSYWAGSDLTKHSSQHPT